MPLLRKAWLCAIGCALVISAGGALVMRYELLDAEPTLSPELYGHALTLHGIVALGLLFAIVQAIPTFVLRPGRGAVVLGFLALGLWAGVIAVLVGYELRGPQAFSDPGRSCCSRSA